MESNTFYDIYLEELKNLPQGTPEEEAALLKKLTEGDKTAASRLTELKLARRRFRSGGGVPRSGTSGGRSGAGGKYGAVSVRKRVRKR